MTIAVDMGRKATKTNKQSGRAGNAFLVNVLANLLADSIFSQSIQPAFFKFHTWFLQGLCFHVMTCSFQLVPNFLVKMHFLEKVFFYIIFFPQISVYIPKLQNYSRYLDGSL